MLRALGRVPLLVLMGGGLSAAMWVPAAHALARDVHFEARVFFYYGILFMALFAALGIATARHRSSNVTRSHLVALFAALAGLPAVAAFPLVEIAATRPLNGWLEMVAAATTTGGSLFAPDRLSDSVHLWRALVAWLGGLMVWIAAAAILAPLRLGGFEIARDDEADRPNVLSSPNATPEQRLARAAVALAPVYAGLTATLALLLTFLGSAPTTATIQAMSTLATSGITGQTPFTESAAGLPGEVVVFAFLFFAVSRRTFASDLNRSRLIRLSEDREVRIALVLVGLVSLAFFARHGIGAFGVDTFSDPVSAASALWGAAFTTLSHLTTTGFVSGEWAAARAWSGYDSPTVLLLGLAMFGGGVATTAGGVKLLRIHALYAHGRREMNLLVHPHSVGGGPGAFRRVSARGIEAAWVFFMLFAVSIALATLGLAASGLSFEAAVTVAVAGLSTTGPLTETAFGPGMGLIDLSAPAKLIYAAAMVIGRLETLALIALFNPDFWRS
jgi:trk system potassium uptake protein TrkH